MKRTRQLKLLSGSQQCRDYHNDKRQWWIGEVEELGLVLTVHGRNDGTLTIDTATLEAILEYNKVDLIHCCHPKKVAEHNPQIAHLVQFPNTEGVCCSWRWEIGQKHKKITTHVAFANVGTDEIKPIKTSINWSISEDD